MHEAGVMRSGLSVYLSIYLSLHKTVNLSKYLFMATEKLQ